MYKIGRDFYKIKTPRLNNSYMAGRFISLPAQVEPLVLRNFWCSVNKKYAGLDFPAWFDGKDVNEAAFCREFLSKNKLIYADNAFFTPDG